MNKTEDIKLFQLISALVFSLLVVLLDSINALTGVYSSINYVSAPVKAGIYSTTQSVNDFISAIQNLSTIRDENIALRSDLETKNAQLAELALLQEENSSLREQLHLQEVGEYNLVEARVIGGDPRIESFILINKGSSDGITNGQVVVLGKYAVGEVIDHNNVSAKVKLITSPDGNIPSRTITPDGVEVAKGLVNGSANNSLKMENILAGEVVNAGDLVITSGVDSNYPFGLLLGEVNEITSTQTDTTKTAKVTLLLDFRALDLVYVITD